MLRRVGVVIAVAASLSGCGHLPTITPYKDPLTAAEHLQLAASYEQQKKITEATNEYRAALRKDSHQIQAMLALGNIAFEAGQFSQAKRWFLRALGRHPNDAGAQNNLAMVYLAQGNLKAAERLAKSALSAEAIRPYAYDTLSQVHARQGRPAEAVADLHAALAASPSEATAVRESLAASLHRLQSSATSAP